MKRGLTVVLAALVLLTGCDGGYGDYGDVSALLITDAESLYLAPKPKTEEAAARDMEGNVMFKITKEGIVIEVTFTNDKGETESTEKLKPTALYHANDDYFIVVYDNYDNHGQQMSHLVSKTNGAVYSLDNVGVPDNRYFGYLMFANSSPVLSDGKSNIYFKVGGIYNPDNPDKYEELYRIDVSNPAKVFAQPLTAANDQSISKFAVDAAGNAVYEYSGNNSGGTRLALAGGGFASSENIPDTVWTAPDGKFYYNSSYYDETTHERVYSISRLDIEGRKVTETEYGKVNGGFSASYHSYYLTSGDRAYILDDDGRLAEVYNPEGRPNVTTLDYKLTENAVDVSEDGGVVYVTGQREVVCIDLNAKTWRYLYQSDEYEIYEATYSGQGVTVNALRFHDGRIIMGKIDKTGKMEVLDEKSNSKVLYLTRIK